MRVFLTGATGFIGGHILGTLSGRGHEITCLTRGRGAGNIEAQALPGVRVVVGDFTRPESYTRHIAGHDAVINAIGIIRETPAASFDAVHTRGPIALFDAAAAAKVSKIVQVSALGADDRAESRYHLSKRAADRHLAGLGPSYVVLRPSLVYGPGDHSMTFFEALAALPLTPVPGDGQYLLHPVYVGDLVHAVVLAIERTDLKDITADLGGGEPLSFDAMLDTLARRLGKRKARKLHVPWGVMKGTAVVTDSLGGRGPITGEELSMLRRGNFTTDRTFVERFGFTPVPLVVGLARKPLTQGERWHAGLTFLRLPLRLSIAFIWLATGLISMLISSAEGYDLLRQVGITGPVATLSLYGTASLEVVLGIATIIGWRVRWMGAVQLLLILGFTAILTAGIPALWWHPFGPLTKNVPLLGATLVMMALEE